MSLQNDDQIHLTSGLLSITMFEQKLMKNFQIINNRLKKVQSAGDLEAKTKQIQKQIKVLTNKIDSLMQKMPKQGNAISKKQVQSLMKQQIIQTLDSSYDKIKQTQTLKQIMNEIQKVRNEIKLANTKNHTNITQSTSNTKQTYTKPTSFTAGSILLSQQKRSPQASKQLLSQILTKQQEKYMNGIIEQDNNKINNYQQLRKDIQKIYDIIDQLKVTKGKLNFVGREVRAYQEMERNQSKQQKAPNNHNHEGKSKHKKSINKRSNNDDSKNNNIIKISQGTSQIYKGQNTQGAYSKQQIIRQQFLARKTVQAKPSTLLTKQQLSLNMKSSSKLNQPSRLEYPFQSSLQKRSKSIPKLQLQKRLKLDDIKDINNVLKQIQLRLEGKMASKVCYQLVSSLDEKVQILRITKDNTVEIGDLRKMIYNLDGKLQFVINFLQSTATEDDASVVKKNWTCISCDKNVQKFNTKIGQHLNWGSIQAKKMSPTKIGGFGQTGQLASKIKNLMDGNGQ